MYSKEAFIQDCRSVFFQTEGNTADIPGIGEIVMYEAPLIGFARADDELFLKYKQPEVIGENHLTPAEWLPSAKTVISFFLPFSDTVRFSNRESRSDPSPQWLYGRIEGQEFINRFSVNLQKMLTEKGIECCVPSVDPRFGVQLEKTTLNGAPDLHAHSRWSERHAAYACGLGTFGLSKGLITEKGIAGRFTSIIVSEAFQASERPYTGIYEYCTRCGACAKNCPAHAISLEYGKNNALCRAYLSQMRDKYSPRYGCGKCQVGVPCEFGAPGKTGSKKAPASACKEHSELGRKIIVLGCSGSGKSTFSKKLHEITGLPLIHLDNIWWKPDRTHISREEFDRRLDEILREDRWILDGDYSRTYEVRFRACDTVVFLDFDFEECMNGILDRVGKIRTDIPWSESELDPQLVSQVENYQEQNRPAVLSLIEKYPDKKLLSFRSRREADEWLNGLW